MPDETPARIVRQLTQQGYNADRAAVTLIADADQPSRAVARVVEAVPEETLVVTARHVERVLEQPPAPDPDAVSPTGEAHQSSPNTQTGVESGDAAGRSESSGSTPTSEPSNSTSVNDPGGSTSASEPSGSTPTNDPGGSTSASDDTQHPSVSTGMTPDAVTDESGESPVETGGSSVTRSPVEPTIENDVTGESTGTGEYDEFVRVFRDRYDRLSGQLRGRVNHRPAESIAEATPGSDVAMVGLVNDIRSTASGHWLVELEDTTGTFPALVMKDRDIASAVETLLLDECIAIEGSVSDDGEIMFADAIHFPDVPRTYRPSTADRSVKAALISDVHVGSQEFMAEAWERFADWLHTPAAADVEYLLICGDMVEGVGVYPDQDEELSIIDIYDQYEAFNERLKSVPGDLEIVMIPGNHDAVRLAEPQPGFDEELREIMSAHDPQISGNPSVVTIEGVSVLMYHGVSLDEVIAELPEEQASYDEPHKAMYQLLKKRHVAPQYGGGNRLAPEQQDYLVIDEVPDVFHTGHVHKLGWGKYHNVLAVNSGCWQAQTDFQKSVNIDPDGGHAPILDLETLDLTVRKFV